MWAWDQSNQTVQPPTSTWHTHEYDVHGVNGANGVNGVNGDVCVTHVHNPHVCVPSTFYPNRWKRRKQPQCCWSNRKTPKTPKTPKTMGMLGLFAHTHKPSWSDEVRSKTSWQHDTWQNIHTCQKKKTGQSLKEDKEENKTGQYHQMTSQGRQLGFPSSPASTKIYNPPHTCQGTRWRAI